MLPSTPTLECVLGQYQKSFQTKIHDPTLGESDVLMEAFGITATVKAGAPQYWGRELGMCWERLVRGLFASHGTGYGPALTVNDGQPCDLTFDGVAVDTKYRLGSGDSGTLKKLAGNARVLAGLGFEPVMLFLREDSLPSALRKMRKAGWRVLQGPESFAFIEEHTGGDLRSFLRQNHGRYRI